MKNTLKNIWSVWGTADKFVAIFSILGILLICLTCSSCQAQPSNIPTMEYNDASTEVFDVPGMLMFAEGVLDFVYNPQGDEYIIEYDDPDALDPDNMEYDGIDDYYYIQIFCDSADFFDYLHWYLSITDENDEFYLPSTKYYIEPYKIDDDYYYRLKHIKH